MSMNINELQTLNDHLNAMQKAMETLANLAVRIGKIEERLSAIHSIPDDLFETSDDDDDARSEWSKARDEVWKLYPEAFSQPTPRGHAVYTKLSGLGGHKIADGKDREDAWIKAAGVVLAQVESTKPQPIDYESLAATNGDSIQPASPRETRTEWEIARDTVIQRYPDAKTIASRNSGGWAVQATVNGLEMVLSDHRYDTKAAAWIGTAKVTDMVQKMADHDAIEVTAATPALPPEWEVARAEVLKRYPDAHPLYRGSINWVIIDNRGKVLSEESCAGEITAWITARDRIREQSPQSEPASPPLEPWQVAKAEVLAKYPDAKCQKSWELGVPAIYQTHRCVGVERIAHAITEQEAWIKAAKFINPPVAAAQPTPSIWSREIPSESGWYWWRSASDRLPQFCRVDIPNQHLIVGPLSGSHGRAFVLYYDDVEFKFAEFGPKIPDAETLASLLENDQSTKGDPVNF